MAKRNVREILSGSQIESIFNALCISRLATIARLPPDADLQRFGDGIREAVRIYFRDVCEPNENQLHQEIKRLHNAARKKDYQQTAAMVSGLSDRGLRLLSQRTVNEDGGFQFPSLVELLSPDLRDRACEKIAALCAFGGKGKPGRTRPTGKRSQSWEWLLYAPAPKTTFEKQAADRTFIMWLRVAFLEATGEPPSKSTNNSQKGPFARLVRMCFDLSGVVGVDEVALINGVLERRRRRRINARSEPVS
jgi:hypothetical protein